ncbi:hypothetical protein MLD38_005258 [Melastoma candidum]|uniref:Uncharacterized protein n=1 Tax=Melastoma candidum TaxID=119954 RepID=A0ACB9S9J8_9MYRT|nr:hypothetical protein MLD38_005258 [Melastoma candidum]
MSTEPKAFPTPIVTEAIYGNQPVPRQHDEATADMASLATDLLSTGLQLNGLPPTTSAPGPIFHLFQYRRDGGFSPNQGATTLNLVTDEIRDQTPFHHPPNNPESMSLLLPVALLLSSLTKTLSDPSNPGSSYGDPQLRILNLLPAEEIEPTLFFSAPSSLDGNKHPPPTGCAQIRQIRNLAEPATAPRT